MSRPKRIQVEGGWYHVFNRGIGRKSVLISDEHYQFFLEILARSSSKYEVEIHGYCLMKNHFHLLIRTPKGNISRFIQHLSSIFGRYLNKFLNSDGSIFNDRFKSVFVDKNSYLLMISRYIHLNPVKANIVVNPAEYRWSSFKYFCLEIDKPSYLITHFILSQFKSPLEYEEFVNLGLDSFTKKFYSRKRIRPHFC